MPHLVSLSDLGRTGVIRLLEAAEHWRLLRAKGSSVRPLAGKSVALVFERPSFRTRVSLEVAVAELGGHAVVLGPQESRPLPDESASARAHLLSGLVQAIALRTEDEGRLEEFVRNSSVPVLNALCGFNHPLCVLAELHAVMRVHGRLGQIKFAWLGKGDGVARSWIEVAGLLGLVLVLACPDGYQPDPALVERARRLGGQITVVSDPRDAAAQAEVIGTDLLPVLGEETQASDHGLAAGGWGLTEQLLGLAAPEVVLLKCLPEQCGGYGSWPGRPRSVGWDQAESRLHTAKAALVWALGADG